VFAMILFLIVLFMTGILLAPNVANNLILARVPRESRPPSSRLANVPTVVIFFAGVFMFNSMTSLPGIEAHAGLGTMQTPLVLIAGACFLLFGVCACLKPIWFMRLCIPKLRRVDKNHISQRANDSLELVSKGLGVVFLLASSYLLRDWFR
jgi:hypothetical protein